MLKDGREGQIKFVGMIEGEPKYGIRLRDPFKGDCDGRMTGVYSGAAPF